MIIRNHHLQRIVFIAWIVGEDYRDTRVILAIHEDEAWAKLQQQLNSETLGSGDEIWPVDLYTEASVRKHWMLEETKHKDADDTLYNPTIID